MRTEIAGVSAITQEWKGRLGLDYMGLCGLNFVSKTPTGHWSLGTKE